LSKRVTILQKPELQVWNKEVVSDCVIYTSLTDFPQWGTVYFTCGIFNNSSISNAQIDN